MNPILRKKIVASLLLFTGSFGYLMAQSISGKITDSKKETVIGAAITIEGTNKGVASDLDGNYKISDLEAKKYVVIISGLGFAKQKKTVDLSTQKDQVLDVEMADDALQLDQVVVVGYGLEQKRDVTGSISTIKAKDINNTPMPNAMQTLQGRAAGLQITGANGMAGSPVKINIRGTNSISGGSQPLIIVDGIPITNSDLSPGNRGSGTSSLADINPEDIESMDVLKDAAACAIYGSRGANGVILITTKKGKSGKTKFEASFSQNVVTPSRLPDLLNAKEHLALRDLAQADLPENERDKPNTVVGVWNRTNFTRQQADSFAALGGSDWIKEVLRQGTTTQADIKASGGNDKTTFYISGSYRKDKGFLLANEYERLNTRIALENKATERLQIGTNLNFSYSKNNRVPTGDDGGFGAAQQRLPYIPILNSDGTYNDPYSNPLWQLENRKFEANVFRTISDVHLDYTIAKGLVFHSAFAADILNQTEFEYNFRNTQDTGNVSDAWDRRTNVFNWNNANYFNYNFKLDSIHDFTVMAGNENQKSNTEGVGLHGIGFSNDFFQQPGNAITKGADSYNYTTGFALASFFVRGTYKLKERYIFNASVRRDGSSRFAKNNKWANFPALSAAWIISDESFLQSFKQLSFLKLRASYGQTGNQNIGDFQSLGFYGSSPGYNGNLGLLPITLANPDLTWEKSQQIDLSLDVAFFKNRLALNVNYYQKNSSDLLLKVTVPTSSGYSDVFQNVGKLTNNGFEFTLNTKNIEGKFSWYTDFNLSINRNRATDLAGLPPDAFESGQPGEGRVIVGYPVGVSYLVKFAGVQQTDGEIPLFDSKGNAILNSSGAQETASVKAGTELFYDKYGNIMTFANPTGNFYDHRVATPSPVPNFFGGISNTFAYAGFDFSFLFSFVQGNKIYDDPAKNQIGQWRSIAQRREVLDAWTSTNPSNEIPSLNNYTSINSSRFLSDASYIRLRSVSFGYNVPAKICEKIKLSTCRIFINGTNLMLWTNYRGLDPEVLRNVDPNSQQGNVSFSGPSFATPQARTIGGGVKVSF